MPSEIRVPFVLASRSPRRRHLLRALELPFEVVAADIDETILPGEEPSDLVTRLAKEKALSVEIPNEALVLAADTMVYLNDSPIGKPFNEKDARDILASLQGKTHQVYTGIALVQKSSNRMVAGVEITSVTFDEMSSQEIAAYVDTGSPLDKAGAYGIQDDRGALFVKKIEGDFYNVMGLPLNRLYQLLKGNFNDVISFDN